MSNIVIAHIDISLPSGRKIVRELENRKAVKMEYPMPESIAEQQWHSDEDVWDMVEEKLNTHYGTNYKL